MPIFYSSVSPTIIIIIYILHVGGSQHGLQTGSDHCFIMELYNKARDGITLFVYYFRIKETLRSALFAVLGCVFDSETPSK